MPLRRDSREGHTRERRGGEVEAARAVTPQQVVPLRDLRDVVEMTPVEELDVHRDARAHYLQWALAPFPCEEGSQCGVTHRHELPRTREVLERERSVELRGTLDVEDAQRGLANGVVEHPLLK